MVKQESGMIDVRVLFAGTGSEITMGQWQPLRVLIICHQYPFSRVLMTNIQCWGYEAMMLSSATTLERRERNDLEGDVLLYDLDEALFPLMVGKDTSIAQRSLQVSGLVESREGQWPGVGLIIALSSRSVSRSMLEQIGAVALLQKPFEMKQLQRYLKVLERLLRRRKCKDMPPPFDIHSGKRRVLVADDNVDITQTVQQCLLSEAGYEVAVAHDGLETLEQCLDWQPQCVVTDLIMPLMNGYQVMRCLSIGSLVTFPAFVIMSALTHLEEPVSRSYLQGKAITYINKPFHIEHLLTAIKQACAG